jgi:glucose-1-phosphatase
MAIRFIFFDLGKVLINFDLDQMMRQVSDVTGATVDEITSALFDDGLHEKFEMGQLSIDEYQRGFCERIGRQPDLEKLHRATTEFFEVNTGILPVISGLCQTRFPMGILSNTCVTHWDYCRQHYAFVRECFQLPLASFDLGMLKPHRDIYDEAAKRAGVAPEEVFFTDDLIDNVEGARAAGWQAEQFTGARKLVADLRDRGVPMNI